jgi:hypothetical protein
MCKKLYPIAVAIAFLSIGTGACTRTNPINGTVSDIKSNVITVKDNKARERTFEIDSAAGIKIAAGAWCEEDCRQLTVDDKIVTVQKVIK